MDTFRSSLPQFPAILLKLDRSNYIFWRALVLAAVRAHGFDDFISSTAISPSPTLPTSANGDSIPNPEYITWRRKDQFLLSWMLSSIGESMLGHVVRSSSSRECWCALERLFTSQSKAKIMQFRTMLQTTKKGNSSVEDYFMKMRGIADQLAGSGQPLTDDELIMYLLAGFGPEFEALVVNFLYRADSPSLQEVQLAFQAYEARLAQQHASLLDFNANVAYRGRGNGNFGSGSGNFTGNFNGRGGRSGIGKAVMCQLCGKTGHVALKCFKRFDVHYTGIENSTCSSNNQAAFLTDFATADTSQEQVYYAEHDPSWYVDSGATAHITNDLQNLVINSPYSGSENLVIGNGQLHSSSSAEGEPLERTLPAGFV